MLAHTHSHSTAKMHIGGGGVNLLEYPTLSAPRAVLMRTVKFKHCDGVCTIVIVAAECIQFLNVLAV